MRYYICIGLMALLLSISTTTYAQDGSDASPTPDSTSNTVRDSEAQTVSETENETQGVSANIESLSFATLNSFIDETLRSPYDTLRYRFSVPQSWALNTAIEAQLRISAVSTNSVNAANLLQVYFNNVYIDTFLLPIAGDQVLHFTLPESALTPYLNDSRHELYLIFDAHEECEFGDRSLLTVKNTSTIQFSYDAVQPTLDLRRLPLPIYQNTFEPQSALIVIPDTPTEQQLQAALITSAAFGRMSNQKLNVTLKRQSDVTNADRENNHLIYIGLPDSFTAMSALDLPLTIKDTQFDDSSVSIDDGVLQLVANPSNPDLSVLLVSGTTDVGLVKAAFALAFGQILTYRVPNLAIIQTVDARQHELTDTVRELTFAEAGYETRTIVGRRMITEYYLFDLPFANRVVDDAVLHLVVGHSRLIDYGRSGISIRLNGEPIGSVVFSDETAHSNEYAILLPVSSLVVGLNEIAIDVDLLAEDECIDENNRQLWLNISNDSWLSLPTSDDANKPAQMMSLVDFPAPFNYDPNLASTRFVLEASAPYTWNAAAQLAAYLGNRALSSGVLLSVSFADGISEQTLNESNLIIIGNRNTHPLVQELDARLAERSGQEAIASNPQAQRVSYRLADNDNSAFIQYMPSPWNADFSVLTVFSHQASGLENAMKMLSNFDLRGNLQGNFAIVQDNEVLVDNIVFTSTDTADLGYAAEADDTSASLVLDDNTRLLVFGIVAISVFVIFLVVVGGMRLLRHRA